MEDQETNGYLDKREWSAFHNGFPYLRIHAGLQRN